MMIARSLRHRCQAPTPHSGVGALPLDAADRTIVPVQAKIHPLKFCYSVAAGFAASAHLAIDVQDTLAELAGQFVKMERDNLAIKLINDATPHYTVLDFTATPSTYYDRQSLYADIELKLNEAESQIQNEMGRGGVSWMSAARTLRTCSEIVRASSLSQLRLQSALT
jgi:hypothetical protein